MEVGSVNDRLGDEPAIAVPRWAIEHAQSFHAPRSATRQQGEPFAVPAPPYAPSFDSSANGRMERGPERGFPPQPDRGWGSWDGYRNGSYGRPGSSGSEFYVRVYPYGNPYDGAGQQYRDYYDQYYRQWGQTGNWGYQGFHDAGCGCGCGCGAGRRSYHGYSNRGYYSQGYYDQGYYDQGYHSRGRQGYDGGRQLLIQPQPYPWRPEYDAQSRLQDRYRQEYYNRGRGQYDSYNQGYYNQNPYWDRMSYTIQSMVGDSIKQYDPRVPEDLGCAAFVSACLKRSFGMPISDTNVSGLEQSLRKHGFVAVPMSQAQPGDVIIGHRGGGRHGHAAIYVGGDKIANNSSAKRRIVVDGIGKFYNGEFRSVVAYRKI